MSKICENIPMLVIFGTFGAHIWPHVLSKYPINHYSWHFIIELEHNVCHSETFYSQCTGDMAVMSKIYKKNVVILCDLWTPYMTLYSIQPPYKLFFYLWDPPLCMQHSATMISLIQCMGNMGVISEIIEKCPFWVIFKTFVWPLDPMYDPIFYSATL